MEQLLIPEFAVAEGFADIVSAADTVSDMVAVCESMIAANPLLCALAATGLVCVGVRVFRSARRASR